MQPLEASAPHSSMPDTSLPLPYAIPLPLTFPLENPPLSSPSKLIEVGCIAMHKGGSINSKLISQMDAFPKNNF